MKKVVAITGIAVGAAVIVAGIITLVRDHHMEDPAVVADDDGLSRRVVEEGENVIHLPNAA